MSSDMFCAGRTYDNVYFLFADAFDLLRDRLIARVRTLAVERRCARATVWGWRGDGGFLAIHDDNESAARDVALEAGQSMLTLELPNLREELGQTGLKGDLHIRMGRLGRYGRWPPYWLTRGTRGGRCGTGSAPTST